MFTERETLGKKSSSVEAKEKKERGDTLTLKSELVAKRFTPKRANKNINNIFLNIKKLL
jgi:hypothetical protein